MATVYHVDAEGLAHSLKYYDNAQIDPLRSRVSAVEGYFDETGAAKNALTLGGAHG